MSQSTAIMPTGIEDAIKVDRWPTERMLFILVILSAFGFWAMMMISLIGIVYGVMIGVFLFFSHLIFTAYIRGSAIKLGPNQFPEIHKRILDYSSKLNMKAPDAYIMQQGGALNAFATKFFRSNIIVLYSDLLEACEDNEAARDMIIGHELGHIKAGHLNWMFLVIPGMFVPFLGQAYSRARERTCDRYGAVLCGSKSDAALGLTILAAGAKYAPQVNQGAFMDQIADMNSMFMTLGYYLSSYPPLCERVAMVGTYLDSKN